MKITFLGAAKTVTGSCYLIENGSYKFLLDCGMFQGHSNIDELNKEPFPFDISSLDCVVLSHSHIDHSGRIPRLYVQGFRGKVIATKATKELCAIMLPDSGHIQEMENEWINRKRQRAGKEPVSPLYTFQDAVDSLKLFEGYRYDEIIELSTDVRMRFKDAGHLLGSSIVEIWINEDGKERKIVFSGDLGNRDIPILRDPTLIESADYLILESTYGNRLHDEKENKAEKFVNIINETVKKGGNVIIPSFAVGRTQEIIYEINKHIEIQQEKVKKLFSTPVYVDSPLAVSATQVFRSNPDCFDEEARSYIENGDNPLDFPELHFTASPEESRALNEREESMIIISASGMCDAGRIKHHLKHNLWRPESTILFVGYQAQGTLGRKIVDGAKRVKIFGEEISVNARIEQIEGFSGHADQKGLMDWVKGFKKRPEKIFIVHGEEEASSELSRLIREEYGIETVIPGRGESFTLDKRGISAAAQSHEAESRFIRLALIDQIETLKEEFEELSEILKADLKQEMEDVRVEKLRARLRNIERSMVDVLRE